MHIYWNDNLDPLDMIIEARTAFGSYLFRAIVITACWIIWNSRNGLILDNMPCTLAIWNVVRESVLVLSFLFFWDLKAPFMHPLCICSYIPLILIQKIGGEIPPWSPKKLDLLDTKKNLIVYVSNIVDLNNSLYKLDNFFEKLNLWRRQNDL